ncbi:hypothetical protein [Spartinivicinus poritis]|uniref:Uncharacterized protein n=1 Tax=Spartinivicinus poritis TaxID=2994640 RepID=A0ABT5U8B8_9GAMM|nr:hypothetical protein [Spartinivicinus sp. A2-2]MDE1462435.1 hypothetical protein [Spartinivicinus sp. A2-2]
MKKVLATVLAVVGINSVYADVVTKNDELDLPPEFRLVTQVQKCKFKVCPLPSLKSSTFANIATGRGGLRPSVVSEPVKLRLADQEPKSPFCRFKLCKVS